MGRGPDLWAGPSFCIPALSHPLLVPTNAGLTCNVVKLFMEMDADLFDSTSRDYRELTENADERTKRDKVRWQKLDELAKVCARYPGCSRGEREWVPKHL